MDSLYKPTYLAQDVKILESKLVHRGDYLAINHYRLQHRLFSDGWSKPITREVIQRGPVVGGLLYDPELEKIVMIEQFRIGSLVADQPWLLEIVAGIMEPDEAPLQVLRREVLEETNLEFKAYLPIYEYWPSPGCSTEKVLLYCAQVDASIASGDHGLMDEGEDIRVHVFSLAQVFTLLQQGKIVNSLALIAVQWLQLNQMKVRKAWGYEVKREQ